METAKKVNSVTADEAKISVKPKEEKAQKLVRASLRYLRMSPTKVRLLANFVKGMDVSKALTQLYFSKRVAKTPVQKLIESAAANAKNNFGIEKDNLYIQSFTVDGGPTLKRWRPRAFGRATMIRKRMSHLNIVLAERKPTAELKKGAPQESKKEDVKIVDAKELKKMISKDSGSEGDEKKQGDHKKSEKKGFTKKLFQRKTG